MLLFIYKAFRLKHVLTLFFIQIVIIGFGQAQCTFSGKIFDKQNTSVLVNATVFVEQLNKGTLTNNNGFFSIDLVPANYTIVINYLGYKSIKKQITINNDTTVIFYLELTDVYVEGIDVKAIKNSNNITNKNVGIISLSAKEINKMPGIMGQPDVMQIIRLMPGVSSGGDGSSGLYVRGGDSGQNLFVLNNMPLYNPSHLLGLYSVFNQGIVGKVQVYKGAIPAQYGGLTSAVVAVDIKQSGFDTLKCNGSIGLLSSDITIESPFNKNKGSVIVSSRKTYLALLQKAVNSMWQNQSTFFSTTQYGFYDITAKLAYKFNPKNHVSITAFVGSDLYQTNNPNNFMKSNLSWGNTAWALNWTHYFNHNFSITNIAGQTNYNMAINAVYNQYNLFLKSNIADTYCKNELNYITSKNNKIKCGASVTWHNLTPHSVDANMESLVFNSVNQYLSTETAIFFQYQWQLTPKIITNVGLRYTNFLHRGPYTYFINNNSNVVYDSVVYKKNEPIKFYNRFSPNISLVKNLGPTASVKASAGVSHQFIHLASVGTVSMPTDIWLPSTRYIKPQQSVIATLGYFKNFKNNMFETSAEVYYKHLINQLEFLNGVIDNFDNTKIEKNVVFGQGRAFGFELYTKKQTGKLTGWASYTLSRTIRQFDQINNGNPYPAKYDRIHDLSVSINYNLLPRLNLSGTFIFCTGNAMTLPNGRYLIQGHIVNDYTNINSFRMPAYHRLDLSVTYMLKKIRNFESDIIFSVYNAYNRQNPFYIYYKVKTDFDRYYLSVTPTKITLFTILPSITWRFKF